MAESKLLKLKTDLKSLKFEQGNEPYVLFPIGYTKSFERNDNIPKSITDFYLSNRTNPDFPLRGGTISIPPFMPLSNSGNQNATVASQIDKERIKKFLDSKPRGSIFLQKQIGLQLSNPKIETESIIPGVTGGIENTRFYNNGKNTLAQVGVQGTGLHSIRHGAIPFNVLEKAYYDTVNEQNISNNFSTNRLIALRQLKIVGGVDFKSRGVVDLDARSTASKLGIALSPQNLFQYIGGPDSTYGIGVTTIKRYDNTEEGTDRLVKSPNSAKYGKALRTYKQINEMTETPMVTNTSAYGEINYKTSLINNGKLEDLRGNIYGIGDPGNRNSPEFRSDRLNENVLLYFDNNKKPWSAVNSQEEYWSKDIIKFVFEAIDNDNPDYSTAVFFRAFLSGITDNHNASINAFKYLGRGEDFYTYQGVSREIGFSFKIAPQTENEQSALYKKLNYLISQVYPDYSPDKKIMRAPLMRLTIGDYFYRLPGMIQTINISMEDTSPWEIRDYDVYLSLNEDEGNPNVEPILESRYRQLPHVINVQCTFKPIHNFLPRRETYTKKGNDIIDTNMNVPFIVNDGTNYIEGQVHIPEVPKNDGNTNRSNASSTNQAQSNLEKTRKQKKLDDKKERNEQREKTKLENKAEREARVIERQDRRTSRQQNRADRRASSTSVN